MENAIMAEGKFTLAKRYITYRYEHALLRKANTTDERILSLLENKNENVKQENSNKNPILISTQRDYMAGEVSKDISKRFLIPEDIWKAHEEGLIHFHTVHGIEDIQDRTVGKPPVIPRYHKVSAQRLWAPTSIRTPPHSSVKTHTHAFRKNYRRTVPKRRASRSKPNPRFTKPVASLI